MKNRVGRACVFLFAWILAATLQVHAQSLPSSITPEQLQMFQSLSPEQQQAVLSALKGSGGAGSLGTSTVSQGQGTSAQSPANALGAMQGQQLNPAAQQQLPIGPPRLLPNSVLLISVSTAAAPCDQGNPAGPQGGSTPSAIPGQQGMGIPSAISGQQGIGTPSAPSGQQAIGAVPTTAATGTCTPGAAATPGTSTSDMPTLPISSAIAERLLGAQGGLVGGEPIDSPDVQQKLRTLLEDRRQQILDGNPYTLNSIGQLTLPTLPPITLWGLSEDEATALLNAEPNLAGLTFKVSLLPVVNVATTALQPFGYDLFSSQQ